MKNILGWVKSNIIIVISVVVIMVSLPVGYVFSSGWNKKIRVAREAEAKKALTDVSNATVTYTLPAAMPGDKPLEVRAVPTSAMTEWFKGERERVLAEVKGVVAEATTFNRKDRKPLVEGLFPGTGRAREIDQKIFNFMNVLCGSTEQNQPSSYQRLIDDAGAGDRADATKVASALKDLRDRIMASNGNRALTAEEATALSKQLTDRRIGELRRRAQEVSFYASVGAFSADSNEQRAGWTKVPINRPSGVPTLNECFVFQWDYWVIQDAINALARANEDASGDPLSVERAPVKRLVKMLIKDPPIYSETPTDQSRESSRAAQAEPVYAFPGGVPLDKSFSVSGRKTNADDNKVYDVRIAEVTLIVASDELQAVLSAFSQTNFMTVIDLDLEDVDPWSELKSGYYYGPDHVVKATIGVESIWLRSWLAPYMPAAIANNLGAEVPEDGGE